MTEVMYCIWSRYFKLIVGVEWVKRCECVRGGNSIVSPLCNPLLCQVALLYSIMRRIDVRSKLFIFSCQKWNVLTLPAIL